MMIDEKDYDSLLEKMAHREKKVRQRTFIIALIPFVFITALYVFAGYEYIRMREVLSNLQREIDESKKVVVAMRPLLQDYGWTNLPTDAASAAMMPESFKADEELRRLKAGGAMTQKVYTVLYYPKDVDGNKVRQALNSFGLKVKEKKPAVEDVPANDVVFGANVPKDNAKIIAYVLIRAGVPIRGIHKSRLAHNADVYQVLANRIVAGRKPLTVDSIRGLTSFEPDPVWGQGISAEYSEPAGTR